MKATGTEMDLESSDHLIYAVLREYGYSAEDIEIMTARQRTREFKDAIAEGIKPGAAMSKHPKPKAPQQPTSELGIGADTRIQIQKPPVSAADEDTTDSAAIGPGMASGIGETLRDHLWERAQAGEVKEDSTGKPGNALTKKILIACILVVGAVAFALHAFRSAETRTATREWNVCANDAATRALKRQLTATSEDLMPSILSDCERQYEAVVTDCISGMDCKERAQRTALEGIGRIRDELVRAREQSRKIGQIEAAVKELEKVGVSRDDMKAFFRDEILEDEAADRNAEYEARAAAD